MTSQGREGRKEWKEGRKQEHKQSMQGEEASLATNYVT